MKKTPNQQERKKACKLLNFWSKILLESDHMNEPTHRKELLFILRIFNKK